ncbi:tyrosine-type recombinase/integrase [Skermanella sp. TT6]
MRHLTSYHGPLPVVDLSEECQQEYVNHRLEEGISPKTISRELSVLRASLYFAKEKDPSLTIPTILDVPELEPRGRWLKLEEFNKLLEKTKSPHIRLYMLLGIATAGRPSAILDLRWDQVDFGSRVIYLNPQGRAQTAKKRPIVRMTEILYQALLKAHAERRTDYVIEYGGYAVNSIRTAFREAAALAGFAKGDVTPYVLRHTAATWMAQDGVPLWEIANYLGHKTTRMVEKYYAHFDPGYQEKARAALDRRLDAIADAPQLHPRRAMGERKELRAAQPGPEKPMKSVQKMVGATGIEPVTPTMST